MTKKSLFIVIEGLDGSGKSSASKALVQLLDPQATGKVKRTYEPQNDCCAGEFIRQVLRKEIPNLTPSILPLAYATNRLDHCQRIVKPFLDSSSDHIIISDRYYLSSLVYQRSADFSFDKLMILNEFALKPDLIFFINVDTQVCYERMKIRNEPPELFESNLSESRQKYFEAINYLRQTRNELIIEIDGSGTIEEVVQQLKNALLKFAPFVVNN